MAAKGGLLLSFFLALVLGGCVSLPPQSGPVSKPKERAKAPPDFPRRIAILPMNNMAGDADGALILRALVRHKLVNDLGFTVQPFDETDQIIRDRSAVGPEVPVQVALSKMDPKILTAWLGVDGILHGELLAFNRAQLSFYTRRQVKAHFSFTNSQNKQLWEGSQDADSGSIGGGSIPLDSYLTNSDIPADVLNRIKHSPLASQTIDLVDETFSTFPAAP
jgi:hypothetical protein